MLPKRGRFIRQPERILRPRRRSASVGAVGSHSPGTTAPVLRLSLSLSPKTHFGRAPQCHSACNVGAVARPQSQAVPEHYHARHPHSRRRRSCDCCNLPSCQGPTARPATRPGAGGRARQAGGGAQDENAIRSAQAPPRATCRAPPPRKRLLHRQRMARLQQSSRPEWLLLHRPRLLLRLSRPHMYVALRLETPGNPWLRG